MTVYPAMTREERERLWSERIEITIGGVEIHSHFITNRGGLDVQITYLPVFCGAGVPVWMEKFSLWLQEVCNLTVMWMTNDKERELSTLVKQDNGNDRLLYRLLVTRKLAGDGQGVTRVSDYIDPEFVTIDAGVRQRAQEARLVVEEMMGEKRDTTVPE